jgi:5'-hydroxyaverantin dehydrogenase
MNGHDPASALDQMMPKGTPVDLTQALDLSNLKEKPVIVTGGASGIGLACATRVAEAGGYVTIADLQSEVGTVGFYQFPSHV